LYKSYRHHPSVTDNSKLLCDRLGLGLLNRHSTTCIYQLTHFGGVEEGRVGPVENKLLSFPTVQGLVFGSFGEASEGVHSLVEALAISRVRVAGPQRGRKGVVRTEDGEKSIAVSYIRRTLSMAAIHAQSHSLLGRL
jgi:hypothetical protein